MMMKHKLHSRIYMNYDVADILTTIKEINLMKEKKKDMLIIKTFPFF